jgi:hypothetical protein
MQTAASAPKATGQGGPAASGNTGRSSRLVAWLLLATLAMSGQLFPAHRHAHPPTTSLESSSALHAASPESASRAPLEFAAGCPACRSSRESNGLATLGGPPADSAYRPPALQHCRRAENSGVFAEDPAAGGSAPRAPPSVSDLLLA